MSKTAVESSGDVKVRVASHLSNLPTMATDALTSNFMELSTGVITKTGGACARLNEGSIIVARKQESTNNADRTWRSGRLSIRSRFEPLPNKLTLVIP